MKYTSKIVNVGWDLLPVLIANYLKKTWTMKLSCHLTDHKQENANIHLTISRNMPTFIAAMVAAGRNESGP